ncbi:hypothetical protein [Pedobacter cryoconitis]|uniref:Uncharacterized protein n=1 Tax=Pedobacter cryoconitis TaxID=188932 RepID=A0A327S0G8_9SPHI|nr:hypothetical protein [Pedobacter cryoconitis]RAJ19247.1 hypothetical protein LY11_05301 [Pedobacter cryoconitis]
MNANKNQFLKDAVPVLVVFALFMTFTIWRSGVITFDSSESHTQHISTAEAIENYKTVNEGIAEQVMCPWCGGAQRVGYAGKSEEQCRRTGMGKGNLCTTCGGTGKITVRHK